MAIVIGEMGTVGHLLHLCCHIVFEQVAKHRVCRKARNSLRDVTNVQLSPLFTHVLRCFVVTIRQAMRPILCVGSVCTCRAPCFGLSVSVVVAVVVCLRVDVLLVCGLGCAVLAKFGLLPRPCCVVLT